MSSLCHSKIFVNILECSSFLPFVLQRTLDNRILWEHGFENIYLFEKNNNTRTGKVRGDHTFQLRRKSKPGCDQLMCC